MTKKYRCPCCKDLLTLVEARRRHGTIGDMTTYSVDLHFECMECSHILSIVVNVPYGPFIPEGQWYDAHGGSEEE